MSTLNYIDENGNINKVGVIPQNYPSTNIGYNNSQSGLSATKVQGAIDELRSADNIMMSDGITSVEQKINTIPLVRYSNTLSVSGAGTNIVSDTVNFDTAFPNECISIIASVRRNASDSSVFEGNVRIKAFDKTGFAYAFKGINGGGYYIDYIAFGY